MPDESIYLPSIDRRVKVAPDLSDAKKTEIAKQAVAAFQQNPWPMQPWDVSYRRVEASKKQAAAQDESRQAAVKTSMGVLAPLTRVPLLGPAAAGAWAGLLSMPAQIEARVGRIVGWDALARRGDRVLGEVESADDAVQKGDFPVLDASASFLGQQAAPMLVFGAGGALGARGAEATLEAPTFIKALAKGAGVGTAIESTSLTLDIAGARSPQERRQTIAAIPQRLVSAAGFAAVGGAIGTEGSRKTFAKFQEAAEASAAKVDSLLTRIDDDIRTGDAQATSARTDLIAKKVALEQANEELAAKAVTHDAAMQRVQSSMNAHQHAVSDLAEATRRVTEMPEVPADASSRESAIASITARRAEALDAQRRALGVEKATRLELARSTELYQKEFGGEFDWDKYTKATGTEAPTAPERAAATVSADATVAANAVDNCRGRRSSGERAQVGGHGRRGDGDQGASRLGERARRGSEPHDPGRRGGAQAQDEPSEIPWPCRRGRLGPREGRAADVPAVHRRAGARLVRGARRARQGESGQVPGRATEERPQGGAPQHERPRRSAAPVRQGWSAEGRGRGCRAPGCGAAPHRHARDGTPALGDPDGARSDLGRAGVARPHRHEAVQRHLHAAMVQERRQGEGVLHETPVHARGRPVQHRQVLRQHLPGGECEQGRAGTRELRSGRHPARRDLAGVGPRGRGRGQELRQEHDPVRAHHLAGVGRAAVRAKKGYTKLSNGELVRDDIYQVTKSWVGERPASGKVFRTLQDLKWIKLSVDFQHAMQTSKTLLTHPKAWNPVLGYQSIRGALERTELLQNYMREGGGRLDHTGGDYESISSAVRGPLRAIINTEIGGVRPLHASHNFVFSKIIPAQKAIVAYVELKTAFEARANGSKFFKGMTDREIYQHVAKNVENEFGNFDLKLSHVAPVTQKALRTVFLAPEWSLSMLRMSMRALEEQGKFFTRQGTDFYNSKRILGVAATAYLTTQVTNSYLSSKYKTDYDPERDWFSIVLPAKDPQTGRNLRFNTVGPQLQFLKYAYDVADYTLTQGGPKLPAFAKALANEVVMVGGNKAHFGWKVPAEILTRQKTGTEAAEEFALDLSPMSSTDLMEAARSLASDEHMTTAENAARLVGTLTGTGRLEARLPQLVMSSYMEAKRDIAAHKTKLRLYSQRGLKARAEDEAKSMIEARNTFIAQWTGTKYWPILKRYVSGLR